METVEINRVEFEILGLRKDSDDDYYVLTHEKGFGHFKHYAYNLLSPEKAQRLKEEQGAAYREQCPFLEGQPCLTC